MGGNIQRNRLEEVETQVALLWQEWLRRGQQGRPGPPGPPGDPGDPGEVSVPLYPPGAPAHHSSHEWIGGDRIGQAAILLSNNIPLYGLDTANTGRILAYVSTADIAIVGSVNLPGRHHHSGTLDEYNGTDSFDILSKRRLRYAIKAADETVNNSTTLQNDDALTIAVEANQRYRLMAQTKFNSSAVADIKFAFTVPTGATIRGIRRDAGYGFTNTVVDLTLTDAVNAGGVDEEVFVEGDVNVGGTAGSVTLQWAQNTAEVSDTKVLAGSSLELLRV